MSSKQRLLTAIKGGRPDRLPVTTHHVMPYFLDKRMGGMTNDEFFAHFGLDPIVWLCPHCPDQSKGHYFHPDQDEEGGFLYSRFIVSDNWQIRWQDVPDQKYKTIRYEIITPGGTLRTLLGSNEYTTWVTEHLIKKKNDIELIGKYVTTPQCDVDSVNKVARKYGNSALIRGHVPSFDFFGQPGCWQDAACLYGIEPLIMATFDDPQWVHELLQILYNRKKAYVDSLKGAQYDILELGGGDASSTVISPKMLEEFVIPYDSKLIEAAHEAGQRIVYHTCGGMMPILEQIASMNPDAMETFTPTDMGGDADVREARKRLPEDMCMIGAFDQLHHFTECSEADTRAAVRQYWEDAGQYGSCILAPSDHFFDAEPELIMAFADEARKCIYQ